VARCTSRHRRAKRRGAAAEAAAEEAGGTWRPEQAVDAPTANPAIADNKAPSFPAVVNPGAGRKAVKIDLFIPYVRNVFAFLLLFTTLSFLLSGISGGRLALLKESKEDKEGILHHRRHRRHLFALRSTMRR
jgi:hypothetical protein